MEVNEFLRLRTAFIRRRYETAGEPFRQIIRKIEAGEEPYDLPDTSSVGDEVYKERSLEEDGNIVESSIACA